MKSYFEEYERKYEKPRVEKITVGFSGIDPSLKGVSEEEVAQTVQDVVESMSADDDEIRALIDDVYNGD